MAYAAPTAEESAEYARKQKKMKELLIAIVSLLASIVVMGVSSCVGILVLIHGWGLAPANWWVILGGVAWAFVSVGLLAVIGSVSKSLKG